MAVWHKINIFRDNDYARDTRGVMATKRFPHHWPFVRAIIRSVMRRCGFWLFLSYTRSWRNNLMAIEIWDEMPLYSSDVILVSLNLTYLATWETQGTLCHIQLRLPWKIMQKCWPRLWCQAINKKDDDVYWSAFGEKVVTEGLWGTGQVKVHIAHTSFLAQKHCLLCLHL